MAIDLQDFNLLAKIEGGDLIALEVPPDLLSQTQKSPLIFNTRKAGVF